MKLIVGLGNPGEKYEDTRHNIGFMVIDHLAREIGPTDILWKEEGRHKAMVAKVGDVVLLKPQTFMNNSGIAVASVLQFYKMKPGDMWAIHDDIDLPMGKIRIRTGGGTAGHNGIESIIKHIGAADFVRFRLGIGRGMMAKGRSMNKNWHHRAVIDFVLSRFGASEAGKLKHLVKDGTKAVRIALLDGLDRAMNRFN